MRGSDVGGGDHPEARPDARTEVVAAPVARAHGIAVPRLLAFQAGEYSLWERVHAETLSELPFLPRAWRELGGELARLHGFLHNDAHAGNVMCTRDGALVALIDWGDAGWGDPAHELGSLPIEAVPHVVAGYEAAGGGLAGWEAMILWDQIGGAVDRVERGCRADAITALLAFARDAWMSIGSGSR